LHDGLRLAILNGGAADGEHRSQLLKNGRKVLLETHLGSFGELFQIVAAIDDAGVEEGGGAKT